MSTDSHRIVIRRRPAQGHGHHGGSWKIAYADFMTAMMAFFLVMWLVMISSPQGREGIAEYFRTPLGVAIAGGNQTSAADSRIPLQNRSSIIPMSGGDPMRTEGEIRRGDIAALAQSEARDRQRLENLRERLNAAIERNPVLRQYRPQLLVDMTSEGLRIQIVDDQSRPMFATGSAFVEPYMRAILRELAPLLNELPNKLSLSGHTDATPYSSGERAYSNWELSADRANASRRELVSGGLVQDRVLRVTGLASTMNLVKDDPLAAINRRISLVVLNAATQRRIERENAAAADLNTPSAVAAASALSPEPAP